MHDPELIFEELGLKECDVLLDLGCGPGDYAAKAPQIIGDAGVVFAIDRSPEMIDELMAKVDSQGITNVRAFVSDISEPLPLDDDCVDVCLIATALHVPGLREDNTGLFTEVHRVLKPGGCLAIIECKKEETPFGPPIGMRLSADEIERMATPCGFRRQGLTDLGNNYLLRFIAE